MRFILCAILVFSWIRPASAWVNGELSIWMDADRMPAMQEAGRKFERDYGIKVNVDATENIPNNFPLAVQSNKGPDVVIFAHDKLGEWADGGLVAPIPVDAEYRSRFDSLAWEAVQHRGEYWAYPLCFEVVGLIYNKKLVQTPPAQLSDLIELNKQLKAERPDVTTILWDYTSPYYSWGIFGSAGAYVYAKTKDGYDTKDIGIATPGAIDALNQLIGLVRAGVLPKAASVAGMPKQMMADGKLAMILSGPWDWPDLMKNGIDFGVAPVPGVGGKPGKAFIGVSVAYINGSSPNLDIARQFLEHYAITDQGLAAANRLKPLGIPALKSLYETMSKNNELLREMKVCADKGEVMPNITQMGRFWGAMGSALQIATNGQASAQSALTEARENMLPPRK
jgi:maltose/maltodextrin transport system substrate-binding protein